MLTKQQILDAYQQSEVGGIQSLAAFLGIGRNTLAKYQQQYDLQLTRKPPKSKVIAPDRQLLDQMYQTMSLAEIGLKYSVSSNVVSRWLIEYGINTRSGKQARQLSASKSHKLQSNPGARDLFADRGWCIRTFVDERQAIQTVCSRLKVAEPTVRIILRQHGIFELIEAKRHQDLITAAQLYIDGYRFQDVVGYLQTDQVRQMVVQLGGVIRPSNSYPRKFHRRSSHEILVSSWLDQWGIQYRVCDRSILGGRELDIVIDSHKLAIEVNGCYHHSEQRGKDRNYHRQKSDDTASAGYFLFHIWEDDITENPQIIRSIIGSKLAKSATTYARQHICKPIDSNQRKIFLEANHIQGNDTSSIAYGLFNNDNQLCAVITFRKPRFGSKADWELVRYCSVINTTVVGGFSKLLTHFRKNHPGSILSYSDNGRSSGNVYLKNGFTLSSNNAPGYYYVERGSIRRRHRAGFTRSKLAAKLRIADNTLTETQLAEIANLLRVWDCGSKTWIIDKEKARISTGS